MSSALGSGWLLGAVIGTSYSGDGLPGPMLAESPDVPSRSQVE